MRQCRIGAVQLIPLQRWDRNLECVWEISEIHGEPGLSTKLPACCPSNTDRNAPQEPATGRLGTGRDRPGISQDESGTSWDAPGSGPGRPHGISRFL